MKPIIVFEFTEDAYTPERAKQFDDYAQELANGEYKEYNIIVLWGGKCTVYYPCKNISFYYHKLKIWLFRKIWKNSTF